MPFLKRKVNNSSNSSSTIWFGISSGVSSSTSNNGSSSSSNQSATKFLGPLKPPIATTGGDGNNADAAAAASRRRRFCLALVLGALALVGLFANLFLLYASVDEFVALLRQRCSGGGGTTTTKGEGILAAGEAEEEAMGREGGERGGGHHQQKQIVINADNIGQQQLWRRRTTTTAIVISRNAATARPHITTTTTQQQRRRLTSSSNALKTGEQQQGKGTFETDASEEEEEQENNNIIRQKIDIGTSDDIQSTTTTTQQQFSLQTLEIEDDDVELERTTTATMPTTTTHRVPVPTGKTPPIARQQQQQQPMLVIKTNSGLVDAGNGGVGNANAIRPSPAHGNKGAFSSPRLRLTAASLLKRPTTTNQQRQQGLPSMASADNTKVKSANAKPASSSHSSQSFQLVNKSALYLQPFLSSTSSSANSTAIPTTLRLPPHHRQHSHHHRQYHRPATIRVSTSTTFPAWQRSPPPPPHFGRIVQNNNLLPLLPSPPPTTTIVTALLDIGRDRWTQYGRTMQQYHRFLRLLLQLRVPMVVFVDHNSVAFVHRERARIGMGHQTRVRQIALGDVPLFTYQPQVARIMRAELATADKWSATGGGWDPAMRTHPEASHPEYVLLVNSKSFFLSEAAAENPFGTEFFAWLDAGYGHGERSVFPANWQWQPTFASGKISLIKLTPLTDPVYQYGLDQLYRKDISVFSGGFIAGDRDSVLRFHRLYQRKFVALVKSGKIDDDQTLLVLLAIEHPELFHISYGDWFDAFELF